MKNKLMLIGAMAAPLVLGQWLNYPTAGVPRTKDGKPNLSGPAPRTRDGKPDISGMWDVLHNRPCPAEGCADMFIPQEFLDIGFSIQGGLPYQPWAAAIVKKRTEENRRDDPNVFCLPVGIVRMYTTPLFRKIIQTPGLVVILNERDMEYRQIFTDGRPLPADPQPSWNGYSTGKWVGDVLVVETNGMRDGLWADYDGSPLTSAAKITERFHRVNYGSLEIEVTVDDAKAYTKPWTAKFGMELQLNADLLEYVCLEGERDAAHMVGK